MPIEWSDLAVFMTAALMLNLTPGNDMMFVLGQSLKGGAKAGTAASLGIATGSLVHLGLVALGAAFIPSQHPALVEAIRWAGAASLRDGLLANKTLQRVMSAETSTIFFGLTLRLVMEKR
jgi:threonine/homoserine/homoserine lactone efflux protein